MEKNKKKKAELRGQIAEVKIFHFLFLMLILSVPPCLRGRCIQPGYEAAAISPDRF